MRAFPSIRGYRCCNAAVMSLSPSHGIPTTRRKSVVPARSHIGDGCHCTIEMTPPKLLHSCKEETIMLKLLAVGAILLFFA